MKLCPRLLWSSSFPLQAAELSLEEMLALYGYTPSHSEMDTCRTAAQLPNMTLDKVRTKHEDTGRRLTRGQRCPIHGPTLLDCVVCWCFFFPGSDV